MRRSRRSQTTLALALVLGLAVAACTSTTSSKGPFPQTTAVASTAPTPPEQVAAAYVDAYTRYDRARLKAMLAGDALADWSGLERSNLIDEAIAFQIQLDQCTPSQSSTDGGRVECTVHANGLGSEELGLGPYEGQLVLLVQGGQVVESSLTFDYGSNGFAGEAWEPFVAWVTRHHPRDIPRMIVGNDPRTDAASLKLWHRYIGEYVAAKSP